MSFVQSCFVSSSSSLDPSLPSSRPWVSFALQGSSLMKTFRCDATDNVLGLSERNHSVKFMITMRNETKNGRL